VTLIIGILCSDGIVVGADGAASLVAMGNMTAQQPVKKLSLLHKCMIVGVSGPISLLKNSKNF
jgi:20S proteasome alpha/beta subunit